MNSKRVVFLLLAVIVAGATAFLARAWLQNERQALMEQVGLHHVAPQAQSQQVLVAKQDIRVGQLIKNIPPEVDIDQLGMTGDVAIIRAGGIVVLNQMIP